MKRLTELLDTLSALESISPLLLALAIVLVLMIHFARPPAQRSTWALIRIIVIRVLLFAAIFVIGVGWFLLYSADVF